LNCEGVQFALISDAKKCEQKYGDLIHKIERAGGSAETQRFHEKNDEIIFSKYSSSGRSQNGNGKSHERPIDGCED
jgi:hypothetical protein